MLTRATGRRALSIAITLATVFFAGACLPVPLGDPEKSKIDARYTGVWEWREEGTVHIAVFRPYDDRTWIVDGLTGEPGEGTAVKPKQRERFKAWLTTVKGETFLTLVPLDMVSLLPGERRQKYFIVARVQIEGDVLTARGIDPQFKKFKEIGTGSELAREIEANIEDVRMYVPQIKATKWPDDQSGRLEKLLDDFSKWK